MFERFTKQAREVVKLAQLEARRLHHSHIGTEHLLVALVEEGQGPGSQVLRDHGLTVADLRQRIAQAAAKGLDAEALATLGIDLEQVRRATEESFGPGALDSKAGIPRRSGHIPFSKRGKKVLELSLREALRLKHSSIGTGHILLGLIREGEGLGARILMDAGIDLVELRDDVTRLITAKAA